MTQLVITALGLLGVVCILVSVLGVCWLVAGHVADAVRWLRRRRRRPVPAQSFAIRDEAHIWAESTAEPAADLIELRPWPAECPWQPEAGHVEMRRAA